MRRNRKFAGGLHCVVDPFDVFINKIWNESLGRFVNTNPYIKFDPSLRESMASFPRECKKGARF